MTVPVGGMRAPSANAGQAAYGVLTNRPGTLSNDFFVSLLDMSTQWSRSSTSEGLYEGLDRGTGKVRWTATPVDLLFGSNTELRAVAELYAATDGREKFVRDFAKAWAGPAASWQPMHERRGTTVTGRFQRYPGTARPIRHVQTLERP
jgi:catalase-peroxidase